MHVSNFWYSYIGKQAWNGPLGHQVQASMYPWVLKILLSNPSPTITTKHTTKQKPPYSMPQVKWGLVGMSCHCKSGESKNVCSKNHRERVIPHDTKEIKTSHYPCHWAWEINSFQPQILGLSRRPRPFTKVLVVILNTSRCANSCQSKFPSLAMTSDQSIRAVILNKGDEEPWSAMRFF